MPAKLPRMTYKIKAAIALAASIGVLNTKALIRGSLDYAGLYQKLAEQGYIWDNDKQLWRKRLHGNGKPVYPADGHVVNDVGKEKTQNCLRLRLSGPSEWVSQAVKDMKAILDLVELEVVAEVPPKKLPKHPGHSVWLIRLQPQLKYDLDEWRNRKYDDEK